MAQPIVTSNLTLNIKETPTFAEFINMQMFEQPALTSIHKIIQGVTMEQQMVIAGRMGKMGIADAACARPNSGASITLKPKNTKPFPVGDTLVICQKDLNPLFKAYFDKVKTYKELFDITGSDEEVFIMALVLDAVNKSIPRLAWFGDTAVAAANVGTAGTINAGLVKYYSAGDGLWKKIFASVLAGGIKQVAINENSATTTVAQEALTAGKSITLFEEMWAKASPILRARTEKQLLVSRGLFENYRQALDKKGIVYNIDITQKGLQSLAWNGIPIVNMETVWDIDLKADFVDNTTNNAYFLPNRAILTIPENTPITTLNENDMSDLESFYVKQDRLWNIAFGFTMDALFLDEELIVVAY
jgi:hypothetical protein